MDLRGNMEQEWKSPRKVDEELKAYKEKRFEDYMQMVDRGELSRELALTAFREELDYDGVRGSARQEQEA